MTAGGAGVRREPMIWKPDKYNFNQKNPMNNHIRYFVGD